jgi:hypothetical protein
VIGAEGRRRSGGSVPGRRGGTRAEGRRSGRRGGAVAEARHQSGGAARIRFLGRTHVRWAFPIVWAVILVSIPGPPTVRFWPPVRRSIRFLGRTRVRGAFSSVRGVNLV